MSNNVERLVGEIAELDLEGLRTFWRERYGDPPQLRSVPIMRQMLAWRVQAQALGGLDETTRRTLACSGPVQAEGRHLGIGARLTRHWKGREVILHDTIEDTQTTVAELTERFGEGVCGLVLEVTDDKSLEKLERKRLQVLKAPTKSANAKQIKIADKIANLRDLKVSPPDWSEARIGVYIQFAEMVAGGCAGINETLDMMFRAEVMRAA